MSRRLVVELTSTRDDGTWTWRAAGAKEPKGALDGTLLFDGAAVGDVVKVEAEFFIDGISIVAVLAPKAKTRNEPERLEILGSGRHDEGGVTTKLVGRKGKGKGKGSRGRGRSARTQDGKSARRGRGETKSGTRPSDARERSEASARPKKPRLKPARTHRKAALAALIEVQRPVAEQLLRGGIPAVRQAIDKQNEAAREAGNPEIKPDAIIGLAEQMYPALRTAEWHDRADAALAGIDEIDLRDLRSVVVASDSAARDDETRVLAGELRDALARRVEAEHKAWLDEIAATLADGRTVRALRLSSRPPKAGAPLPAELAERLAEAAGQGLTAETSPDRYATVLDAVAFSPVRTTVTPAHVPDPPGEELAAALTRLSTRIPHIAQLFGIEPTEAPRRRRRKGGSSKTKPIPPPPPVDSVAPSADAPVEASTSAQALEVDHDSTVEATP